MNTNTNEKQISDADLDSLLDLQLDDIADLPEFKVFPPGAYTCTIEFTKKVINNHPSVELKLVVVEVQELTDPSSEVMIAGTESSVAFMMDNEFGAGKFKKVMAPLAEHFGTTSVLKIIDESKGLECLVVTTTRQSKDKKNTYLDIVSLQVI